MATQVRIQNFQSIEAAELDIQGFVALAGPNNAGKSAVARAIRGVFLNTPAEALVRSGAGSMRVEVDFGGGQQVAWGREGDRPYYEVNGAAPVYPGRDVPAEVQALGIRPVEVGADKCWPNFARQFDPPFLIERSGAALAEAVSNPERVSLLAQAVRCLDGDLRSLRASISVQDTEVERSKKDLAQATARVALTDPAEALKAQLAKLRQVGDRAKKARDLVRRLRAAEQRVAEATRLAAVVPPRCGEVRQLLDRVREVRALATKLYRAEIAARHAAQGACVPIPPRADLQRAIDRLRTAVAVRDRVQSVTAGVDLAARVVAQAEGARDEARAARERFLGETSTCMLCQRPL